jgi:hypothetical protein
METKMEKAIGALIAIVTLIVGLSALFSYFVMLLWNGCLVPAVGVNDISWLQAWGITILCSILFKSTSVGKSQ